MFSIHPAGSSVNSVHMFFNAPMQSMKIDWTPKLPPSQSPPWNHQWLVLVVLKVLLSHFSFRSRIRFVESTINIIEFFTIRSHLHFTPEFTSRGLKLFSKKLPPVGIELSTLTITGSKVECLSK